MAARKKNKDAPPEGATVNEVTPDSTQDAPQIMLVATSDDGKTTPLTALDFGSDEWIGAIYSDPRRLPLSVKDACFHSHDAKGNPTGVVDDRIFQYLIHTQHIVVCDRIPYIYRDGYFQMDFEGTKMPENCLTCDLAKYYEDEDASYCPFTDVMCLNIGRQDACPLVALPEKHGRLVDADVVYDKIAEQEGGYYMDMDGVDMGLQETPTVLEAEGEN